MFKKNVKMNVPKARIFKDEIHFNLGKLVAFLLVFAAIGGFFVWRSLAAEPVIATVEAESLTMNGGSKVFNASKTASGKAVFLPISANISGNVNLPSSGTKVEVNARGKICSGSPQLVVEIDGKQALTSSVSTSNWKLFSNTVSLSSGVHSLNIKYSGEASTVNGCENKLFVDSVTFYGQDPATVKAPTVAFSASPSTLDAGNASTLTWISTDANSCSASGAWSGSQATSGSISTGALNSTSTYKLSCQGDGGSISASVTVTVNIPPPPSATSVKCTKTLQAGGNIQSFVSSLIAGDIGCLKGGTYNSAIAFKNSGTAQQPITLRSVPGERATLALAAASPAPFYVPSSANYITVSDVNIDGSADSDHTSLRILGDYFTLERNDITNNNKGTTCGYFGSSSSNQPADKAIIRLNKFHNCGQVVNNNLDHSIYANFLTNSLITDNVFWSTAGKNIQLYPQSVGNVVTHNVIDGGDPSSRGGIVISGDDSHFSKNNLVEMNTIAYANTHGIYTEWGAAGVGTGNIARNNCLFANKSGDIGDRGGVTFTNNVHADPQYENRSAHDYSLGPNSTCKSVVQYDTYQKVKDEWAKNG